jgi:hypothetical protein
LSALGIAHLLTVGHFLRYVFRRRFESFVANPFVGATISRFSPSTLVPTFRDSTLLHFGSVHRFGGFAFLRQSQRLVYTVLALAAGFQAWYLNLVLAFGSSPFLHFRTAHHFHQFASRQGLNLFLEQVSQSPGFTRFQLKRETPICESLANSSWIFGAVLCVDLSGMIGTLLFQMGSQDCCRTHFNGQ